MYKIYQIEYGDTISTVAKKTNTTEENIKKINGINNNSDLIVGELIIVPRNDNQVFDAYIVKQGDTIYSIATMYKVDPEILLLLNGLNKNDYIYPNQELIIPKEDFEIYITKYGDSIDKILNMLNIDAQTLNNQNEKIYVEKDQLIINKKR